MACVGSGEVALATLAATVAATEPHIEIVGERRRAHDAQFRTRIVEASLRPGACIRDLARQHGICVSLIYRWRRSTPPGDPSGCQIGDVAPAARTLAAATEPAMQFVRIGTVGSSAREGHGGESVCARSDSPAQYTRPMPSRPAMDERPGMIEIDLADGTRLRVDAFVNERALRRVLAVPRANA